MNTTKAKKPKLPRGSKPFRITYQEKELPVTLGQAEKAERAGDLSSKFMEREKLEDEKKAVAAQYTAKMKQLDKELAELAFAVNEGKEMRDIEVMTYYGAPTQHQKTTFRMDTLEAIEQKGLNQSEQQEEIDDKDANGKVTPKPAYGWHPKIKDEEKPKEDGPPVDSPAGTKPAPSGTAAPTSPEEKAADHEAEKSKATTKKVTGKKK